MFTQYFISKLNRVVDLLPSLTKEEGNCIKVLTLDDAIATEELQILNNSYRAENQSGTVSFADGWGRICRSKFYRDMHPDTGQPVVVFLYMRDDVNYFKVIVPSTEAEVAKDVENPAEATKEAQ